MEWEKLASPWLNLEQKTMGKVKDLPWTMPKRLKWVKKCLRIVIIPELKLLPRLYRLTCWTKKVLAGDRPSYECDNWKNSFSIVKQMYRACVQNCLDRHSSSDSPSIVFSQCEHWVSLPSWWDASMLHTSKCIRNEGEILKNNSICAAIRSRPVRLKRSRPTRHCEYIVTSTSISSSYAPRHSPLVAVIKWSQSVTCSDSPISDSLSNLDRRNYFGTWPDRIQTTAMSRWRP